MATYTIEWTDGTQGDHGSYDAACDAVRARYPDAEIGHAGDLSDGGDRTLCWPDAEAAVNDAGARAVAEIRLAR